ncbi:hypothetical protein JCM8202_005239 [Rhodotorula sphaerocarpa]
MQLSLLEALPDEVLRHVLRHCGLNALLALAATSRGFHELITSDSHGFLATYARTCSNYDPRTLKTLAFHQRAPWPQRAQWTERTCRRWSEWDGRGSVIGGPQREWRRCLPTLKIWDVQAGVGTVLVAKGRELELWLTRPDGGVEIAPVVVRNPLQRSAARSKQVGGAQLAPTSSAQDDATAFAAVPRPGEIIVSRVSGVVQRLRVEEHVGPGSHLVLEEAARYGIDAGHLATPAIRTTVQTIHSRGNLLVSSSTTRQRPNVGPSDQTAVSDPRGPIVSLARTLKKRSAAQNHAISLHSIAAPWQPAITLPLPTKPWSVHVSPSQKWLAVGQSGTAPLSIYQLDSTGAPISTPTAIAHTVKSTSVYGIATPSLDCSPFSNPEQTLIGAFYDSTTRIYDLRIPSFGRPSSWDASDDDRPSNEVARLVDPWSDDPCYSLGIGGAVGAYVAVGTARNAAVRLFDVRSPVRPTGITAFAPGRDRSPIYALEVEGSRVWGCTESRGFVLDFEAFEAPRKRMDKIAYVSHQEGEGGTLRWMGDHRRRLEAQ